MSDKVLCYLIHVCAIFLFLLKINAASLQDNVLVRSRRQLLFLNSSLLQFNVGIGTPTPAEKINLNWAFQANFQLPWNRSQIPFDILEANSGYDGNSKKKREVNTELHEMEYGSYQSDAKLYHFYKFIEEVLNGFGENGTSCVLRTLCQLGAQPLYTGNDDDLLHDIASFVLNPNNDLTTAGITEEDPSYMYIEAHKNGEDGENCNMLYDSCTTSLIDIFSQLAS